MSHPTIAVTMGDPAGIGPELVAKVLANQADVARCRPVVIGDRQVMGDACRVAEVEVSFIEVESMEQAQTQEWSRSSIPLLRPAGLSVERIHRGAVQAGMGEAAIACLRTAYTLAMAGSVDGVVAAPMNKEAFHLAGYDYADELSYLAAFTQCLEAFTMGVMDALWIATVTEHIPFKEIAANIRRERVLARTQKLHAVLKRVGIAQPRIGIAALNPHGGENGRFGREELDEIAPAVRDAHEHDIDAVGPIPADTIFLRAQGGEFDGVVCMYHDQANIARKLRPVRSGATVFMGLPVVGTTTAHGTAFDKAGQGIADPGSLRDALRYAVDLARGA